MKIPTHLKHKPIVGVSDYDTLDAMNAKSSDAKALSIGKAQYNRSEISVKVWRHSDKKWSRQSEELPIHRVFDLSSLILASIMQDTESNYSLTSMREEILDKELLADIKDYYLKNEIYLRPRIEQLEKLISDFKTKMK